jgi:hypothetical protein
MGTLRIAESIMGWEAQKAVVTGKTRMSCKRRRMKEKKRIEPGTVKELQPSYAEPDTD